MADFLAWKGETLRKAKLFPSMAKSDRVMLIHPDYFDVEEAINPHMMDEKGELNHIDKSLALQQWLDLKLTYERIGVETLSLQAEAGCPDMVFCANQSLPYIDSNGQSRVLMSHMHSEQRQREVLPIAQQLQQHGLKVEFLPTERMPESMLEGTGDALWVPGRRLLLGGYGFRTHPDVYKLLNEIIGVSILRIELRNPQFYHLDTCISILSDEHIMVCKEALQDEDFKLLKKLFKHVIEVDLDEADSPGFATNAYCPDGKHVLIQNGNKKTVSRLAEHGFTPINVETSEFVKSGGSVFCMKLALFP